MDFLGLTAMVFHGIKDARVDGVNLTTIILRLLDNPSVVEEITLLGSSPVATIGRIPTVMQLQTNGLDIKSSVSFAIYMATLHSNALNLLIMETKHQPISPLALYQPMILP